MLAIKQKAAALTTARKNNRRSESYRDSAPASITKLQIGTLLLALQAPMTRWQRAAGWQLLEALLSARYAEGVQ